MPGYRGMIPGMFTMGNAVCGFLAILSLFDDQVVAACWFVILAGFLDALDGKVARLSGVNSQFGRELDSLADFVSFGVAPAAIVHVATLSDMGRWGWVISIVFIMAAAYRLARFNLLADDEEKKAFLGLPVPAAGFALVTFVIFSFEMWGELRYDQVLIATLVITAFLMVSQVQYDAVPEQLSSRRERFKLLALVVAILVVAFRPRVLLFPFIALYILSGLVREAHRLFYAGMGKVTGRQQADSFDDQPQ